VGGDEFEVLLPKCTPGQVQTILNRLSPLEVSVENQKITLAFSASSMNYQSGETPEQLLQRADTAFYAEKQNRKNRVPANT
jgi:GGDEF domain-containing protein